MKVTMNLDGSFTVSKSPRAGDWNASVSIDLAAIPESLWEKLALHGLKQKIADAASGAKTKAEAEASMAKACDALIAGDWSSRGEGTGASFETIVARSVMRNAAKLQLGAKSEKWAEFTGLSDSDQLAKLDAWLAGPAGEKLAPQIAREIELRRERAANKAEAAKGLELDF